MKTVRFEQVTSNHIAELREIYLHYVRYSTATFHKRDITLDEMKEILIFSNPKYESYALYSDEEIAGYVILAQYKVREAFDQSAEITIYLKSGYEGRGLGKIALKYIEERARVKDIHTLIALICGENTASIGLFEKNGYNKCAHYKEVGHKFNRWLDLVCYQKML